MQNVIRLLLVEILLKNILVAEVDLTWSHDEWLVLINNNFFKNYNILILFQIFINDHVYFAYCSAILKQ